MNNSKIQSFKLDYCITNHSVTPILVKMKGGLSYIVQRVDETTFNTKRTLFVKLSNVLLDKLMINQSEALTKLDLEILRNLEARKIEAENDQKEIFRGLSQEIVIEIDLDRRMVERNDAIHSELLGFTLYGDASDLNRPALNTPGHTFQDILAGLKQEEEPIAALCYLVYVNDPKRVTKPYYVNLAGRAVEVPVSYDPERPAGLYVVLKNSNETQETPYYRFDELNDKKLESIGIFESRQRALEGGNTERYLASEQRCKELANEGKRLRDTLQTYTDSLQKAEERVSRLMLDAQRTSSEHAQEIKLLKNNEKISLDIHKHESRMKDAVNKATLDYVKQRSDTNSWGELAKAVGTLAGIAFTGYKLLSS